MSGQRKRNSNPDRAIGAGNSPATFPEGNVEGVMGSPLGGATGGTGKGVGRLAEIEGLVRLQTENARLQAANLAQTQDELVRAVECVRDLALAAAGIAQKLPLEPLALNSDLGSPAREVILLARVLRQIRDISKTTETTIENQIAKIGELVKVVGEAAEGSLYLTRKLATLAEQTSVALPVLSSKHLVAAEVECLAAELQKVLAEFRGKSERGSEEPTNGAAALLPANSTLLN